MTKRGAFIVLDGPDGSGTTVHSRLLAEHLKKAGYVVLLTAEPSDGPIGHQIRSMLQAHSLPSPAETQQLFCKDRAEHLASVIEPALAAGKTVVCDRYVPSTLAYGKALGLDEDALHLMNKNFIQPDILLLTMAPIEVCRERMGMRKEREALESGEIQKRVHEEYRTMAKNDPSIMTVDTTGPLEEVASELWERVRKML